MPEADDRARAPEMNVHLEWPAAGGGDGEGSEEPTPTARGFFLGQLPDDQPDDLWPDEPPDGGEGNGADLDRLATSFETELQDQVATGGDETELSLASDAGEPTQVATGPVPPVGARTAQRAARRHRARARLSRIAIVAGVVAALAAGTAVYVGTRANAGDERARRPPSTSFERQSPSTTVTTAPGFDAAPSTEPAPDPAATPGSAVPASRPGAPQGTISAPTLPRAPGSTAAPPSTASPPGAPPPPSPMCQLLGVVCP